MIPSAPSLSLAMRGGDAARALLAALGVVKKVDILDRSGFDDAARRLALHLLAEIEGPTNALAKRLEDELGVNWGKLSPAKREAAIVKAETLIGELGRRIAPDLAQVLRGNAPTLIKATRQAAIGRFELPIAAKLDESGVDSKAMEHLAGAHELFVKDQYGRISAIFGARARAVVETGISQGYDYQQIGKDMFATIGAQLGKGQPYCTMVASVFVARARSASILASFDEAEIEKFELSAVLDEATCFAGWTRVLLGDGKTWAPIHKLRAGDVVMSCKGRPRHVVRRVESKARTWVSLLVRGARRPVQVTQTHGILTPSGWVRAQHLRPEGTPVKKGVSPITRIALYDPANQRLDAGRLWSDEREWGMRLGRIDPHTVDCHPWPAPDLAHLGAYGAFGEILEAEQETLGQTPTSCADAFDLEVDEDHGYIAEGMVVHNSNICRALDGKVFYTREAIAKLEQVARAEQPDAIKDLQPFVQDGKDDEGNPILYANQDGARVQVARVVESGAGKRDERGKYEGLLNEAKLSSMGVTTPPFHGHCFPGETEIATPSGLRRIDGLRAGEVVTGGLSAAPRSVIEVHQREHAGDLVVVETSAGQLRLTEEHPLLTGRGWIEAGALQVSDKLRCHLGKQRVASTDLGSTPADDLPTEAAQQGILRHVGGELLPSHVPLTWIDLDGDFRVGESKVEVEHVDRKLADRGEAGRVEGRDEDPLDLRRRDMLAADGLGLLCSLALRLPADGGVRRIGESEAPLASDLGEPVAHRIGAAPARDARALHDTGDTGLAAPEVPRDLGHADPLLDVHTPHDVGIDGQRVPPHGDAVASQEPIKLGSRNPRLPHDAGRVHAGPVEGHGFRVPSLGIIHILAIRREPFAGPVFNIAVDIDESYIVGEIVVHNCRTLTVPAGFEHVGGGSRGGDAAPTQVQVPVAVKPPPAPVAAPQPAPAPTPVQAPPAKPKDPNDDLLLPLPSGLAQPTTFVNARGVRVPVFEGKRSAAQLRGVETLYALDADGDEVAFESGSTMGIKPAPAKGNPMPYADKLRGLGTIEQILAAHGETLTVGDKALDVVHATQRTVDRRAVAAMIAKPLPAPDVVPTYVKYGGKLYLHAGHEEIMAAELGALTKEDRASKLIDLDKLGEAAKPETKAWLATLKADVGQPAPEKQKAVREALRAQIRSYGMVTRDDRRGGTTGQGFPVPGVEMNDALVANFAGADATHGWQGQTTLSGRTLVKTRNATTSLLEDPAYVSRSLARGQDPAELTTRLDGLRVLLHEEIHGASPALAGSYRGIGVGMEEAATEILARKVARDVVGLKDGWALPTKNETTGTYSGGFGVYGRYISGLFTEVSKVTGDGAIIDRVEAALLETRRWHAGEVYRTGEEQVQDFTSRLQGEDGKPLSKAARDKLVAALSSPTGPFASE